MPPSQKICASRRSIFPLSSKPTCNKITTLLFYIFHCEAFLRLSKYDHSHLIFSQVRKPLPQHFHVRFQIQYEPNWFICYMCREGTSSNDVAAPRYFAPVPSTQATNLDVDTADQHKLTCYILLNYTLRLYRLNEYFHSVSNYSTHTVIVHTCCLESGAWKQLRLGLNLSTG